MTSQGGFGSPYNGGHLADISRGVVQLHKKYYGTGPTKAKTHAVDDTLLCLLKDGFTRIEQTLMAEGRFEDVEVIRAHFHRAMEGEFKALIEDVLGRPVVAHMSAVHCDPDITVELFVLEPAQGSPTPDSHPSST